MNKRGQTTGLAILAMIFVLIIGLTATNFLPDQVDNARTSLNCASEDDISDGTKLTCLMIDIVVPYWIWIILAMIGGIIISRLVIG